MGSHGLQRKDQGRMVMTRQRQRALARVKVATRYAGRTEARCARLRSPSQTSLSRAFHNPTGAELLRDHYGPPPQFCACGVTERSGVTPQISKDIRMIGRATRSQSSALPGVRSRATLVRPPLRGVLSASAQRSNFCEIRNATARSSEPAAPAASKWAACPLGEPPRATLSGLPCGP